MLIALKLVEILTVLVVYVSSVESQLVLLFQEAFQGGTHCLVGFAVVWYGKQSAQNAP